MHPPSASVLPSLLMVLDFVLSQAWILCNTRKTSHLLLSSFTVIFPAYLQTTGIVIELGGGSFCAEITSITQDASFHLVDSRPA